MRVWLCVWLCVAGMSSLNDLLGLLQSQQSFVKKHARRVRRACADCEAKEVTWELFGMSVGADEALAAVEASPELLTKLDFRKRRKGGDAGGKSAWETFASFFGGGGGTGAPSENGGGTGASDDGDGDGKKVKIDVERELGTLLSAREIGQIYGHVSTAVAETFKTVPEPGAPTGFDLAVQLPLDGRCPGDGGDGAVFLTVCLEFEAQNGLRDRRDTLDVDTRLYAHSDGYLGAQVDRLVDISGRVVADAPTDAATDAMVDAMVVVGGNGDNGGNAGATDLFPAVAVAPDEVKGTLSKEAVYLASTSRTFIVHEERPIDAARVGVVAHSVTKTLVENANRQITEFFERRRSR